MFDCGESKLHAKVNNFRSWAKANYPEEAEKYAIDFRDRKKYDYDEYQKIMVQKDFGEVGLAEKFKSPAGEEMRN